LLGEEGANLVFSRVGLTNSLYITYLWASSTDRHINLKDGQYKTL